MSKCSKIEPARVESPGINSSKNKSARNNSGRINSARTRSVRSLQEVLDRFFSRHRGRANFNLAHLWENWPMVMGEELAAVARPLGVHGRSLIIGAEDSMLLQELSFMTPEILDRANAFMDEEHFENVRLELLRDRAPLDAQPVLENNAAGEPERRERPENLGSLLDKLDPDSPIGRAYRSYVKSFED